jgi:hypothetical protein
MQQNLCKDMTSIGINPEKDVLIYAAPRGTPDAFRAYARGKDLYVHEQEATPDVYYLHEWSNYPGEDENLEIISIATAERFLEQRGLVLSVYPEQRGSAALRAYGFGINEEF